MHRFIVKNKFCILSLSGMIHNLITINRACEKSKHVFKMRGDASFDHGLYH